MEQTGIRIEAIFVGQPQTIEDENGVWHSSIYRDRVEGQVEVTPSGLAGDRVTDTEHHGQSGYQEICCHSLEHYQFWNEKLGLSLRPGNVGENWTLAGAREDAICLDDTYRVGSALIQVSVPRVPCSKQSRRIGREDWVKLTLAELRTGFYLRVLEPGTVQAGDEWTLLSRPHPTVTVTALNRTFYHEFDENVAAAALEIPRLHGSWASRLKAGAE